MTRKKHNFWQTKALAEMNESEWESLCDGCGKCCLVRLQDDETNEIHTTNVACKLLNTDSCRCSDYKNRKQKVPGCLVLRPLNDYLIGLLPDTCAYRLLSEGQDLPEWHPLVSGCRNSVIKANISVSGKVISEKHVHAHDLENYIID